MRKKTRIEFPGAPASGSGDEQSGFGLVEFLISAAVMLLTAGIAFSVLTDIQRTVSYQTEVQSVLNNTRIAVQTVGRYVRQAGNDPLGSGVSGISIASPSELQVRSDLTGSCGAGNPDNGDPDGDTNDSYENVTIRYNGVTMSLEIVPAGGPAQIVSGYISGLTFRCYDAAGQPAAAGKDVRKINVTISGASLLADPKTRKKFGVQLSSDFQVAT
jgi:type II secretory pathway pseudopilin PulG